MRILVMNDSRGNPRGRSIANQFTRQEGAIDTVSRDPITSSIPMYIYQPAYPTVVNMLALRRLFWSAMRED
jgi:hypothetical protein